MTLRLITGAANAGKTGLAYAALEGELEAVETGTAAAVGTDTERALAELSAMQPYRTTVHDLRSLHRRRVGPVRRWPDDHQPGPA